MFLCEPCLDTDVSQDSKLYQKIKIKQQTEAIFSLSNRLSQKLQTTETATIMCHSFSLTQYLLFLSQNILDLDRKRALKLDGY